MDVDDDDASWNVRAPTDAVLPRQPTARRTGKIIRPCPKNDPEDPDVPVIARVLFSQLPYVQDLCNLLSGFINSGKDKDTKAKSGEGSADNTSGSTAIADIIMRFKRSQNPDTPDAGTLEFLSPNSFNAFNFIAQLSIQYADRSFPDVDSYVPSVIVPAHSFLSRLESMAANLAKKHTFFFMFVLPERVTVSSPVMDSSVDRDISIDAGVADAPLSEAEQALADQEMEEQAIANRRLKRLREEQEQARPSMYSTQPRPVNTTSTSTLTSHPVPGNNASSNVTLNGQVNTTLHFDVQLNFALPDEIQLLPGVDRDEMGFCLEPRSWQDKSHFKNHYTVTLATASFLSTIKQWGKNGNGKSSLNIRVSHKLIHQDSPATVRCLQSFEMHLTGMSPTEHDTVVQEMEIDPTHPQWQHIYECVEYTFAHAKDMPIGSYVFKSDSTIPGIIPACNIPFSKMYRVIKGMPKKEIILSLQLPRVGGQRNTQLVLFAEPNNPSPNNTPIEYVCPFYVQVCLPISCEDGHEIIIADTSQKIAELKTLMPRMQLDHNGAVVHETDMARFHK